MDSRNFYESNLQEARFEILYCFIRMKVVHRILNDGSAQDIE